MGPSPFNPEPQPLFPSKLAPGEEMALTREPLPCPSSCPETLVPQLGPGVEWGIVQLLPVPLNIDVLGHWGLRDGLGSGL